MAAMFGHTWASQYGVSPTGLAADTWAVALSGVTPMQLANGLRETLATGAEFPPSAPRFRAMCFGIPSLASVKYLLRANQYDRFVVLVQSKLDSYLFARADQKFADRLLAEAYDVARDHVMRGGALPEPPAGHLEAPKPELRKTAPPEVVETHMREIAALLDEPMAPTTEATA